jgi:glutamate racemase
MVELVIQQFSGRTMGLIGTKRTVQSGVYARKIEEADKNIILHSLATPLLAPIIEEGFFNNQISHEIIAQYLSDPSLAGIEGLILACTHYPLIKHEINEFYQGRISILDSSETVAAALMKYLKENDLLKETTEEPSRHFYVSDYTESFEASTRLFFREKVHLEKHVLWQEV